MNNSGENFSGFSVESISGFLDEIKRESENALPELESSQFIKDFINLKHAGKILYPRTTVSKAEVEDMCIRREEYSDLIASAAENADVIISFRLNIPGPYKKNRLLNWAFASFSKNLLFYIAGELKKVEIVKFEISKSEFGDMAVFALNLAEECKNSYEVIKALKMAMIDFENSVFCKYLPDIDVYYKRIDQPGLKAHDPLYISLRQVGDKYNLDKDIFKMSRRSTGVRARPCMICGSDDGGCFRKRKHSIEQMEEKIYRDLTGLYFGNLCEFIADEAIKALFQEAALTPKPGLVDAVSNGAHDDMNIASFTQSITHLRPYFYYAASLGAGSARSVLRYIYRKENRKELKEAKKPAQDILTAAYNLFEDAALSPETLRDIVFAHLRRRGRSFDLSLYSLNAGVNTLMGQIFSLGILSLAAAFVAIIYVFEGRSAVQTLLKTVDGNEDGDLAEALNDEQRVLFEGFSLMFAAQKKAGGEEDEALEALISEKLNLEDFKKRYEPGRKLNLLFCEEYEHNVIEDMLFIIKFFSDPVRKDKINPEKVKNLFPEFSEYCLKNKVKYEDALFGEDFPYKAEARHLGGARAEVLSGLRNVFETGINFYRLGLLRSSNDERAAALTALYALMTLPGDTCAARRDLKLQIKIAAFLNKRLSEVINSQAKDSEFEEALAKLGDELDKICQNSRYSPGGAADMLGLTIMSESFLKSLSGIGGGIEFEPRSI